MWKWRERRQVSCFVVVIVVVVVFVVVLMKDDSEIGDRTTARHFDESRAKC